MSNDPEINYVKDSGNYTYIIIGIIFFILIIVVSIGIWYWYNSGTKTTTKIPPKKVTPSTIQTPIDPTTTLDSISNPTLKDKQYIMSPNKKYMFGVGAMGENLFIVNIDDKKSKISTNISYKQKLFNQDVIDVVESCKKSKIPEEMFMENLYGPITGCQGVDFSIDQSSIVDANCLVTAMQEKLANNLKDLSTTSIAGLDLPGSPNVKVSLQKIKQKLQDMCGNMSSAKKISPKDITIPSCKAVSVQNATEKSKCEIEALQTALTRTTMRINAESKGKILTLRSDGNLVLKTPTGKVVYSTGAIGPGHYTLNITDDGKLILSDGKDLTKTINL